MPDDWTVDITLKTPPERQASLDEVTTNGELLGRPAELQMNQSTLRLKVSGFDSSRDAEVACPKICFGLYWLGLSVPISFKFDSEPQKVNRPSDPREGAINIGKSFGADFGEEVHGLIDFGAPAIYRTSEKIIMFTGGDARFVISGLGEPHKVFKWIDEGAQTGKTPKSLPFNVKLALELFNLSGFEPSLNASFLIHCTILEQLFPREAADQTTRDAIEAIAGDLKCRAGETGSSPVRVSLLRLRDRISSLKNESISNAIASGVARTLCDPDSDDGEKLRAEIKEIYGIRGAIAHQGRAELGTAPTRLQEIVIRILKKKLGG